MSMSVSSSAGLEAIPGLGTDPVPYRLAVFPFPPGHFQVHSFRAREALSKPYVFDITVTTTALVGEDLERLALGQRAAFVMTLDGVTRVVPGVIASVRSLGVRPANDAAQFRLRLVPALWCLGRTKGSRIFQNQRVDEVVQAVLGLHRVPTRWQLARTYPARPYCTQYEETDLELVERLLSEAGIFYFFAAPASGLEGLLGTVLGAAPSAAGDALGFASSAATTLGTLAFPEETLVLTDDPACYAPVAMGGVLGALEAVAGAVGLPAGVSVGPLGVSLPAPSLRYLSEHGFAVGRSDKVTSFAAERSVRPNVAEYRDFDPERPQSPIVAREPRPRTSSPGGSAVEALAGAAGAALEASAHLELDLTTGPSLSASLGTAAMGALGALLERRELETYEHHGRFLFPSWADCDEEPGRMRRERRRRQVLGRGASLCHNFTPGHRFHLADHPVGPFNREYVVTAVRHSGKVASEAELYENAFECVPASVPYPPKRRRRTISVAALTATVAGPAGEEIWVDAAGRIKVLFHWDRRGRNDEHASCWVRHVEPWGGAGWGHQFVPRIGMEVLVVFEGGDPDKPIVTGCLHNGTHPPAFPLPAERTRSGVRTRSTPHGAGYNELSFEDAAGKEQVLLRAQRDLDELVLRNHTLRVEHDELVRVGGLRRDEVVEDLTEVVGGSKDVTVEGDQTNELRGSLLETIDRNADYRVQGLRQVRIDGSDRLEVAGAAEQRFARDLLTRVEGNHTVIVGRNEAKRSFTLRVEGTTTLSSEDGIVL
ncbi:MAG: type VI secretion system tip protein VgrG, partial [Polyangiaceae bacterium]|nr:type VI secretion system tip protein VgrG [Polyangiaceae bacterium]